MGILLGVIVILLAGLLLVIWRKWKKKQVPINVRIHLVRSSSES